MANKYLDSAGLSHLWGNLKALLSDKADKEVVEEVITQNTKPAGHNILNPDGLTSGYTMEDGTSWSSSSLYYTEHISVAEGDIIRSYTNNAGTLSIYAMRFITAYKDGVAQTAKGTANVATYTVPAGVNSIVISLVKTVVHEITKNYEATTYEAYSAVPVLNGASLMAEKDANGNVISDTYVTRAEFEALKELIETLNVGFAADETDMYTTYTEAAALVDELDTRLDGGST